jgi:hypothetical protein
VVSKQRVLLAQRERVDLPTRDSSPDTRKCEIVCEIRTFRFLQTATSTIDIFIFEVGPHEGSPGGETRRLSPRYCDQRIPVDFAIREVPIKEFSPHLDEFCGFMIFATLEQLNIFIFEEGMKEYSQSDN